MALFHRHEDAEAAGPRPANPTAPPRHEDRSEVLVPVSVVATGEEQAVSVTLGVITDINRSGCRITPGAPSAPRADRSALVVIIAPTLGLSILAHLVTPGAPGSLDVTFLRLDDAQQQAIDQLIAT